MALVPKIDIDAGRTDDAIGGLDTKAFNEANKRALKNASPGCAR